MEPLWDIRDTMSWFKCSRGTVYRLVRECGLPAIKPGGGDLRFVPDEVRAWAESQRKATV